MQKKIGKIIIVGLLVYYVAINIIYDPSVNIWIYYKLFPDVFTFKEYQNAANLFHTFTQSINCLILTTTIILFMRSCLHTIPVKMLRTQLLIVFISYFFMCLCYFLLFSFSPQWYLTISKAAGTTYFRPIRLSTSTLVYQMLPYLLIIAAGMISVFYIRYHQFIRSLENANLEVSRQISAAETTSKVFCHFIKNELLGIQSQIAVLPATTENEQQIEQLLEHCRLLYNRIDSIHRSTKTSELTLKKNSLQGILHSTLDLFTQELDHITVNNYLPKENVPVLVDEHYFAQAIHNLIHNAITALDDKIKVTDFKPTLTFWLYQADKWLVFSVEDNGIGISEKNLSKIFTPFFSSKTFSEHWGIGLPLTHKIITAHEGQIQVESTYGRGSCFKIYLPNVYNIDP